MKLINQEGEYWTEGKGTYTDSDGNERNNLSFWSKFDPAPNDKRDFWFLKTLLIWIVMKIVRLRVRIVK